LNFTEVPRVRQNRTSDHPQPERLRFTLSNNLLEE
jgi:hypothetical protein